LLVQNADTKTKIPIEMKIKKEANRSPSSDILILEQRKLLSETLRIVYCFTRSPDVKTTIQ